MGARIGPTTRIGHVIGVVFDLVALTPPVPVSLPATVSCI
jgi:hypothetical protein